LVQERRSGSGRGEPSRSARGQAVRSRTGVPSTTSRAVRTGAPVEEGRPGRDLGEEGTGPERMLIRGVQGKDLDGILALARRTEVFTSEEVGVVKELVESELGHPEQREYRSLVTEADGHIVGFACYGPTPLTDGTYDLYWIFVHPSYQGRSIGTTLLSEVEKALWQIGGRMLMVDTSSTQRYLPARRFYRNHGFQKAGEVKDFYRPGDSLFIYVKQLADGAQPDS
jgi:ribosomal protein S18 acetylase RimI-like enzyme